MRIAIPVVGEVLSLHFGHCEKFAFFDVDTESGTILAESFEESPPHQPGLLPRWVREKGATVVIAGGMGIRAQQLFENQGVRVIVGAPPEDPRTVVEKHLAGTLETGSNVCDH